jgi:PRTRC genetic system ThiF family protein
MLGHKLRAVILAVVLVFTAPWPARAQIISPCCALLVAGLSSIQSALTKVVGGGLNQILGVDQAMQQFQQAVVWPQNLISQARNLVGLLQGNFNQIQNLMHLPVNSATLPLSQQLEQVILSRNPNQIAQTSGAYTALYGPVPAANAASPQVLNMVDMTDAAAQAAMKRAIEIDALADLELQAANQLKAIVLAHRINLFWGLNWQGMQATIQQLKKGSDVDFVIGCVDTRKARRAVDKWALRSRVLYWLDLGNNASSGQFVLGQPKNSANRKKKNRLPTVAELYPEILKRDTKEDDQPSCSAAEALTRQEPFINQNLAYQALAMLTQLLRHGSVSYQGGFCNLATGQLAPIPIRTFMTQPSPKRTG